VDGVEHLRGNLVPSADFADRTPLSARASGKKGAGGKIFVESRQTALDPSRRRMYLTLLFVLFRRDFSENAGFRTLPGRQNGHYSPETAATLSIVST
jgi:hypothetical protein